METSPQQGGLHGHVPGDDSGDLHERIDARLLTEVQKYDPAPSAVASYGDTFFWDGHYSSNQEIMEWYLPWSKLAPWLTRYMDGEDDVLVCGCGNSEMSIGMHDDGFLYITNADISRVAIDQMKESYKAYRMEWRALDLTREQFPEETFDVTLDKACLDSIISNRHGANKVKSYLQQMDRILQKEGAFICVSLAPPEERLELLEYWDLDSPNECLAWDVHVHAIGRPELEIGRHKQQGESDTYFIYVCLKDPRKTLQKKMAQERLKREQEKKLGEMLGRRGRRGKRRGLVRGTGRR